MTVFDHFAIGRSAMRAFRLGMNISGYNVANSQTPGFSRRRIELGTMPSVMVPGGLSGTGVDVIAVKRLRDPFLDFAARREFGRLGADESRAGVLAALEPALGEVESAPLRASLSGLFEALQTLSTQPDSTSGRHEVVTAAQELASTFRRTAATFTESRQDADERIADAVTRVDDILTRLAQINQELAEQESSGEEASDLRDERDRLTDELSNLVAVRTVQNENGAVNIYLDETGDTLLAGTLARGLTVVEDVSGLNRIQISRGGESVDLTDRLRSGAIGGLVKVRDVEIVSYREQLDTLASAVISEFNAIHESGYDLDGQPGLNLFDPDPPGSGAAIAIQVNAVIENDPRKLVTSSEPNEPGNTEILLDLIGLGESAFGSLDGRTFVGYAADVVAAVGHDLAEADAAREASRSIVDSLDLKRQSLSGVSLDDEATDLVRWQQSFQAAAQFMRTVNEVTQTALSILGG